MYDSKRWGKPVGLLAALVVALCLVAPTALAQTAAENKAAARALGIEGIKLAMEGNCEAALDKLERAHELFYAPTIAVWLGECQIEQGELLAGTETLQRVVREPLAPNAPSAFRSAQARARTVLDETLPRLANLTVTVNAPADARYEVLIDGKPLPAVLIGVARPIDPGDHQVEARGEGLAPAREAITLPEGESRSVALTLLPVADAGEPAPPVAEGTGDALPVPDEPQQARGLQIAGYSSLVVGGLGIIAGAAFGVSATSQRNDLDDICIDERCPPGSQDDIDSMGSAANLSTAGFVVGGVGVALGTTLLVVARGKRERTARRTRTEKGGLRVVPVFGVRSAGLQGRF